MKIIVRAIVAVCLLAACSPAEAPAPEGNAEQHGMPSGPRAVDHALAEQDFRIAVVENAAAQRFDLTITSLSEREICLGMTAWPDESGQIVFGSDVVSIDANRVSYPMEDSPAQDCGTAGVRTLAPGASVQGFIGFDQFPQEAIAASPRTLSVGVQPYFCDSGERE